MYSIILQLITCTYQLKAGANHFHNVSPLLIERTKLHRSTIYSFTNSFIILISLNKQLKILKTPYFMITTENR